MILLLCVPFGIGDTNISSGLNITNNSVLNETVNSISSDHNNSTNTTDTVIPNRSNLTNKSDDGFNDTKGQAYPGTHNLTNTTDTVIPNRSSLTNKSDYGFNDTTIQTYPDIHNLTNTTDTVIPNRSSLTNKSDNGFNDTTIQTYPDSHNLTNTTDTVIPNRSSLTNKSDNGFNDTTIQTYPDSHNLTNTTDTVIPNRSSLTNKSDYGFNNTTIQTYPDIHNLTNTTDTVIPNRSSLTNKSDYGFNNTIIQTYPDIHNLTNTTDTVIPNRSSLTNKSDNGFNDIKGQAYPDIHNLTNTTDTTILNRSSLTNKSDNGFNNTTIQTYPDIHNLTNTTDTVIPNRSSLTNKSDSGFNDTHQNLSGNITGENASVLIPAGVIEAWNLTQGTDNSTHMTDSTAIEISPVKNTSQNVSIADNNTTAPYVPGEVIIQYKTTPVMNTIAGTIAKDYQVEAVGGEVTDDHSAKGLEGLQTISVNNTSVSDVVAELNNSPIVEYAEPNYIISLDDYGLESTMIPNDPNFSNQWALLNTGQTGGTAGADIDATSGWSYTTGSKNVIIAVIDSGVDYTHPDLNGNIWTNSGEIPGNGIDDDGDGYVDDVYGYDFINNKGDPMDDNGHGTHCAGVIGAVGNNGVGITGLDWNVKIMPLKVLKADGTGDTASVLNAIAYAKAKGASIISCSWGGSAKSMALSDALANSGMLIVCAAGNTGVNNDINPHYPSNYDASNIIAVAASDANDSKPSFSNYGPLSVDVAAPGDAILSTYPTNLGSQYMSMRGTSMATPHVSGLAGLILAMDPTLSPTEVKQVIMNHVDPVSAFSGKIVSGGRINVKSALSSLATADSSLIALPGSSSVPSVGSDGKVTDLNGNRRTDFADIVLFFKNSDWISSHEPIGPFDLNNNGKVDFNDIILFYNKMI